MRAQLKFFILSLSLIMTACSGQNGFQANSLGDVSPGNSGSNSQQSSPETQTQWNKTATEVDAAVDGGTYSGQTMIKIDQQRKALQLILPLPPIFMIPLSSMALTDLPGAGIEAVQNADGSESWAVVIPLKYILHGANLAQFNTLPNGDALPFLPAGEVHGLAIQFPQKPGYRLTVYMAVNAAAVFIETPDWEIPAEFGLIPGFPVVNKTKTRTVGYFKIVPNKGAYSSGVYLAAQLPAALARTIDDLIRF